MSATDDLLETFEQRLETRHPKPRVTRTEPSCPWERVKLTIVPLGQSEMPHFTRLEQRSVPRVLDLHGMTIAEAHSCVKSFVLLLAALRIEKAVIVTGKSGPIRKEFPTWMDLDDRVRRYEVLASEGAFRIRLKRKA